MQMTTNQSAGTGGGGGETPASNQPVERSYDYYRTALDDAVLPAAFVDMDRIDANADDIRDRADGVPVRVASKSVRCRAVLEHVLEKDGFEGLLCYSGREAAYLALHGFDDLVVAYPIWHQAEIEGVCDAIASGADVQVMIDSPAHADRLSSIAEQYDTTIATCLDLDLSTTHLGVHFGVRRSGIQTPEEALAVCDQVAETDGVEIAGLMGYEAQLAGIPDDSPANNAVVNAVIRLLKRRSRPAVRDRRTSVVRAIKDAGYELELVNGGGTGCVEFTVDDPSVTEVTVGSGLYAPGLFDYYRRFQHHPAAGFAIELCRNPTEDIYTCRGGGYVASGPPQVDRAPKPWLPEGMTLREEEGAGEVQTPVIYDGDIDLSLGAPMFFRHAKAGELPEQFEEMHLIEDGAIAETVPTYRGDGRCFI